MTRRPARSATRRALPAAAPQLPIALALALAAAFAAGPVLAQPSGAQAIHGTATLSQQGSTLVVNTTNGAGTSHSAINWQSFSIPAGTTTRFVQPGATSTSINRVMGPDPSAIFGTLSSNGRLVLVNPNGIAVGTGAVVDTAGFTASTLRIGDADAIAGRLRFGDGSAAGVLRVDGQVLARSGDVVLIAPDVQAGPQAVIRSPEGATILAAGRKVELTGRGLEGIRFEVQAPGDQAVNLGTLQGDAVGVFAGTLRHSGLVQASAVTTQGGRVVLRALDHAETAGTLQAQGLAGAGGQVDVLGRTVGVMAGAVIDTSNSAGGGRIRVGGDYQGKNADVPNAQVTWVDRDAQLRANATQQGDGGRVIVWADDTTRAYGRIEAKAGPQGGNGGFVETSGKRFLDVEGVRVDASAAVGQNGQWLLDPSNVTIKATGSDSNLTSSPNFQAASGTADSIITQSTINTAINGFTSVTISTSSGFTSPGDIIFDSNGGNITIQKASTGTTTLTLQANRDIVFTGSGTVDFTSTTGSLDVLMNAASGSVKQNTPLTLSTSGGGTSVRVKVPAATTWTNASTLTLNANGEVNLASGASFFNNGTINGAGASTGGISGAGNFTNTASGVVAFTQGQFQVANFSNSNNFSVGPGTDMTVTQSFSTGAGTPFDFSGNNLNITQQAGNLLVQGSGTIAATGAVNLAANAGSIMATVDLVAASANISASQDIVLQKVDTAGTTSRPSAGPVQIAAGRDLTFVLVHAHGDQSGMAAGPANGGNVQVGAANNITGGGIETFGGDNLGVLPGRGGSVTINAGAGATIIGSIDTSGGIASATYGGDGGAVTVTGSGTVSLPDIQTYGSMGRAGGYGGKGGAVNINVGGQVVLSDLDSTGGNATSSGGNGGNGGNLLVRTGSGLVIAGGGRIDTSGGNGGSVSGGNGGNGGNAGSVTFNLGGTSYLDTEVRAAGGDGGSSILGQGGNGGNGAPINVALSPGAYLLADPSNGTTTPGLHAAGGVGGNGAVVGTSGAGSTVTTSGGNIWVMASLASPTMGSSPGNALNSLNIDAPWTNSSAVTLQPGAWMRVNGDVTNSGVLDVGSGALLSLGVYDQVAQTFFPGGRTLQNSGVMRVAGTVQANVNNSGQSLLAAVATALSGVPLDLVQQVITEANTGSLPPPVDNKADDRDKKPADVVVTDTSCKPA